MTLAERLKHQKRLFDAKMEANPEPVIDTVTSSHIAYNQYQRTPRAAKTVPVKQDSTSFQTPVSKKPMKKRPNAHSNNDSNNSTPKKKRVASSTKKAKPLSVKVEDSLPDLLPSLSYPSTPSYNQVHMSTVDHSNLLQLGFDGLTIVRHTLATQAEQQLHGAARASHGISHGQWYVEVRVNERDGQHANLTNIR